MYAARIDGFQADHCEPVANAGPSHSACFLDGLHRRACRRAITFEAALGHVQQERLGGRDATLDDILADRHDLPEYGLIGRCFATPRTPARIAALALLHPRCRWRFAMAGVLAALGDGPIREMGRENV